MIVMVISGGRSAEREISLLSGGWVREELEKSGHSLLDVRIDSRGGWSLEELPLQIDPGPCPWRILAGGTELDFDLVFPVLHGPLGEDGTIQGLCEIAGWKYAGAPVMGCAVAMDKHTMKLLARDAGIPVLPWVFTEGAENLREFAENAAELGFPLFVKPSRLGSSVGISRVNSLKELMPALERAREHDGRILVEKALDTPRELEVSVLGSESEIEASVPGEILPGRGWYDYEAKYSCSESKLLIPAPVTEETALRLRSMAGDAFRIIGGTGYARVDFLINGTTGEVFFNEINTIPGFTSISMFPKLWQASGLCSGELLDRILREALHRRVHGIGRS
jgi:D-alanine-D-alanine ligase